MSILNHLKKTTLIATVALLFSFTACEELNMLDTIAFPYEVSKTFTVPAETPSGSQAKVFDQQISPNLGDKYDTKGINADHVESIKITGFNFIILEPQGHTFQFMDKITAYIKADTLPEIKLGHQGSIPDTIGDTLELETPGENLMDYIQQDQFNLRVEAATDQPLNDDLKVESNIEFNVAAKTNISN